MKTTQFLRSLMRILLGIIVGVPLILYPFLYVFQEKLLFIQTGISDYALSLARTEHPDSEVRIKAPDGTDLHGWYINNTGVKQAPLLIYFGGNAEEVSGLLPDAKRFRGWAMLLMNYRGYGLSRGNPTEANLFRDALFLYDRFSEREEIDRNKVVAMGRSLGSGVAVYLASRRPLRGVILVTPYDSITRVAQKIYPYAPVSLLLKHKFDSLALAPSVRAPMLALIAADDRTVEPIHARNLAAHWGGKKHLTVVRNSDHSTIDSSKLYWQAITDFLRSL